LGQRSATAPPIEPKLAIAAPWAATTLPTAVFVPDNSNATTLCTIIDMKNAMNEKKVPNQRIRKCGTSREANVLSNQSFTGGTVSRFGLCVASIPFPASPEMLVDRTHPIPTFEIRRLTIYSTAPMWHY
jgi:hypothetical protein